MLPMTELYNFIMLKSSLWSLWNIANKKTNDGKQVNICSEREKGLGGEIMCFVCFLGAAKKVTLDTRNQVKSHYDRQYHKKPQSPSINQSIDWLSSVPTDRAPWLPRPRRLQMLWELRGAVSQFLLLFVFMIFSFCFTVSVSLFLFLCFCFYFSTFPPIK